jgi:hypothetical protein
MLNNIAQKNYNIVDIIFVEFTIKFKKFVYFILNI